MTTDTSLDKGHRARLRARFLKADHEQFADYELLEMLLFASNPRGDVKPLAKNLLATFGNFARVLSAPSEQLIAVKGMGEAAIAHFKVAQESAARLVRAEILDTPLLNSGDKVKAYCHARMAYLDREQFRLLYLDRKNQLMLDEVQQQGTVDHIAVYPREVMRRALELGASALILVHNHPSGDPTPSTADIDLTNQIHEAAKSLSITLHDHLIIGKSGSYSFRERGLL